MQKYAKKMVAVICLFFVSVQWYQSDQAEANTALRVQDTPWFNIACVPTHRGIQGLDTDLRKRGLSQFSKNIHSNRGTNRISEHRCYFRVNPTHIGCFNPRLITKEYLEMNGFNSDMAFPGGNPGQICYFKKEFAHNYRNLMTILKRNGTINDLNQYIVNSGAQAVNKLAQPVQSEIESDEVVEEETEDDPLPTKDTQGSPAADY